jgi:ribonuclease BN (tRNA processing enzyme)
MRPVVIATLAASLAAGLAGCCPPLPQTEVVAPTPEAKQLARAGACRDQPLAMQILGSGGPIPDDPRASSGYLIWRDGKARLMIDAGGGTFVRFAEAGAQIADLDAVLLSHLHADHAGELPTFLKGGYFAERKRPLAIVGPTGNERFPAIDAFVSALVEPTTGPFRYLSGYLDGRLFALPTTAVDPSAPASAVLEHDGIVVEAVGVHHGAIPALGYVVTVGDHRVAFGGDQSAKSEAFVQLAKGADILVAHHAIPESGAGVEHLHRTPSQIAQLAQQAGVGKLVLSHHMTRALDDLMASLELMRSIYTGPIEVGEDLGCYPLVPSEG